MRDIYSRMYLALGITLPVSYLHKKNIVHRDIKPSNVIVSNLHYSLHKRSELRFVLSGNNNL